MTLFSKRARVNGPVFLLGWVVGLAVAFGLVYALASATDPATDETSSDAVSWVRIVLGAALLVLAGRSWSKRPAPGATPALPKWMSGVDELVPFKAFVLAVLLAAANPKNLVLIVGAATGVAQLGLPTRDAMAALVVFVVVGSLSVAAPVSYYLVGGEGAKAALDAARSWLTLNNATVMTVLFVVFGVVLISNGLAPLTD